MYSSVFKREVPEFIIEYLIFCDLFTDLNKQKTYLVLTKDLKLFEFQQKQLVASVNLSNTCLNKHKEYLQNYEGPKGRWYETLSVDDSENNVAIKAKECNERSITLGKYVFHALNIYKIYILIKCWDKCVVVRRLPNCMGFKIIAEYECLLCYKIIHGSLKFCPVVEFQFRSSFLRTDFEDRATVYRSNNDLNNRNIEMKQLLERIRNAKTELHLHKTITAQSFHTLQNNLTMGLPFLRSLKLEEKQILNRCGDIWERLNHHDDLIIGIPLVNQCASPNLSIIRNVTPILQPLLVTESTIRLQFRLFQLNLKFGGLDSFEMFLEAEDDQLQEKMWCPNGDIKILPESFVVLLVKFKISEIISLQKCPLILNYEVKNYVHGPPDLINRHSTMSLQLYIKAINFHKILFEERLKYRIAFTPEVLHQDFLTIAMTSEETNLKIIFDSNQDLEIVENYIQNKLDFTKQSTTTNNCDENNGVPFIYYNKNPNSVWFSCLILWKKNGISEKHNERCSIIWKMYCSYLNQTLLLLKTFLNDILTLNCNILSISCNAKIENTLENINNFETILRNEIKQIEKILNEAKYSKNSDKILRLLKSLCHLQFNADCSAKYLLVNN